jgi:uncharacterized protein involved in exopolysaccharide biosynthesis
VTAEKPEAEKPKVEQTGTALEPVRASAPRVQPVLTAAVVGAIILAIAIGAFCTSF